MRLQAEQHLAALPAKQQQLVEQEAALHAARLALDEREAALLPREAAAEAIEARAVDVTAAEAALEQAQRALAAREAQLQDHQVGCVGIDSSNNPRHRARLLTGNTVFGEIECSVCSEVRSKLDCTILEKPALNIV